MNEPTSSTENRLRPLVARRGGRQAVWTFFAVAALGGSALFASLEHRRAGLTAPAIAPGAEDCDGGGGSAAILPGATVAPLALPPDPAPDAAPLVAMTPRPVPPVKLSAIRPGAFAPPVMAPPMGGPLLAAAPATGPEVVYDASRRRPQSRPDPFGELAAAAEPDKGAERVQAGTFSNPATTVPRGVVIQAVLETALDSTWAGMARAIISRDVMSFDGSRVLIARGSRLIGEYKADLASGQSRALIQWQRLTRPDGVIINLDSPSADPLGRAGVKGKVNSHVFAQFGRALLRSSLDVGQQVAVNKLSGTTAVLGLPGLYAMPGMSVAGLAGAGAQPSPRVQPTLTVRHGTSVSVFVARDLDFTGVE